MLVRTERFAVHSYEVDAFGLLAAPALAGYLQEVAGLHAAELGCGLEALRSRGLTWVLSRQRIDVLEPIALGEALEIATWPSGTLGIAALRDFEVRRRGGRVAALAATHWLVVDLRRRRPVRPDRVLDGRLEEPAPHALTMADRIDPPAAWDAARPFEVRYQDIDGNLHVNNTSYIAWAVESLPRQIWQGWRLASVEAHYLAEGRHGDTVVARLAREGEGGFVHALSRDDGARELARLRTRWERR